MALPKLFESICLNLVTASSFSYYSLVRKGTRRSLRVLRGIAKPDESELDFASMVRELQVTIVEGDFCGEESKVLELALKRLTNLKRFVWFGEHAPSLGLCRVLPQERCSVFLHAHRLTQRYADAFALLTNVKCIETIDEWAPRSFKTFEPNAVRSILEDIITRRCGELDGLSLNSYCVSALQEGYPDKRLSGLAASLTHFAIMDPGGGESFSLRTILLQAHALKSLALVEVEKITIPLDADVLPNLRDLKISIRLREWYPGAIREARKISNLILLHKNLQRFDFSLTVVWGNEETPEQLSANATWFSDILNAVCTLGHITALGLTFPALEIADTERALSKVTTCETLKKTCKALRLDGITNVPLGNWTSGFVNCTFLALSNQHPDEFPEDNHPLSLETILLNHKDLHLERICLRGRVYDNLSVDPDGQVDYDFWTVPRAGRRTEKDFCSPDAYWLMLYRLLQEPSDDVFYFPGEDEDEDDAEDQDTEDEDTEDGWSSVIEDQDDAEDDLEDGQDDIDNDSDN